MRRFRTVALAAAAAATVTLTGVAAAGPASAEPDAATGKQILDVLCEAKDGTAYFTPFTISRCQEARSERGFLVEELVCESLLGGSFAVVPSPGRPDRANWFCFPGIAGA